MWHKQTNNLLRLQSSYLYVIIVIYKKKTVVSMNIVYIMGWKT